MSRLDKGTQITLSRQVTAEDVERFADLSLDRNPIHFDYAFAKKTVFKKPIAHGMIGAALISGCLTELVGPGNIWLSANYKFLKPIFIGDKLSATLTVSDINRRGVVSMELKIKNQLDELLIAGEVQSMRFLSG